MPPKYSSDNSPGVVATEPDARVSVLDHMLSRVCSSRFSRTPDGQAWTQASKKSCLIGAVLGAGRFPMEVRGR
eukprot:9373954-Lingulodinium_polyedra.AAC.1